MRKLFALIGIFLFSLGCGEKRPADVLPQDKFQDVMWDMIKAGEFLDGYVLFKDTTLDKSATITAWYNKVYQIHSITKAQFEKSYAYYQDKPKVMKEMLDTLSKRQLTVADTGSKPIHPDSIAARALPDSVPAAASSSAPALKTTPSSTTIPGNLPPRSRKQNFIDSIRRIRQLQRNEELK